MPTKYDLAGLLRKWSHSHEEDNGTELCFRDSSYAFPLSRGRMGYEFAPQGRLIKHSLGPTDRSVPNEGTWSVEDDDTLRLDIPGKPAEIFEIVSLEPGLLVLRRK